MPQFLLFQRLGPRGGIALQIHEVGRAVAQPLGAAEDGVDIPEVVHALQHGHHADRPRRHDGRDPLAPRRVHERRESLDDLGRAERTAAKLERGTGSEERRQSGLNKAERVPLEDTRSTSPTSPLMHLQDKVAVVTGASRGLGRAFAEALAAKGAQVYGLARSESDLADVADAIGDAFHPIECDVRDPDDVHRAFKTVKDAPAAATSSSTTPGSAASAPSRSTTTTRGT